MKNLNKIIGSISVLILLSSQSAYAAPSGASLTLGGGSYTPGSTFSDTI
jgi:hypothetical protein